MSDQIILDAVDKFLERDVAPYAKALELNDEYPEVRTCPDCISKSFP